MADSLQKTDRLIESQGRLTGIAVRADQKADITAKGVADLTRSTQKQFEELRTGQDQLRISQESLPVGQGLILQILREKLS